jgi:hypothetical protein
MTKKITTGEIRRAIDLLLSEFEANGASEWEIDRDFYCDVPWDRRYDSHDPPTHLNLGQLTDDIERVKGIADGSNSPVPPGLVWLASILRIAGETGVLAMKQKG